MSEQNFVTAYKGFDKNLQCRGYQFEVGKTYNHEGEEELCKTGFHSCKYPLDVFRYYNPACSRFAVVKVAGKLSMANDDSKVASASLIVEDEVDLSALAACAVGWIMDKLDKTIEQAIVLGYQSAATNTGDYSAATNTGDYSAATNTGNYSAATNTGYQSAATNTGDYSAATNTGNYSAATNTGYQSAATNTGDYSAATNTGDYSAATNTGDYSAATNTGYQSAATNTGNCSAAEVSGTESVAASFGINGRARASAGNAIVLCYRDSNTGSLIHVRSSKVGDNGIKPDTWYTLDDTGEFIEVCT